MAKQEGNVVTHGLSGKIGDLLLFRQVGGKTIVSEIPEQSKTASEKQQTLLSGTELIENGAYRNLIGTL
jgi:hypothetical protein